MHREIKVVFQPSGRTVHVLPGTPLIEAAGRAGVILQAACGGVGTCGKCVVRIHDGEDPATETECRVLGGERVTDGYRLACRTRVNRPMRIEVPASSLFESDSRILTADMGNGGDGLPVTPAIRKTFRRLDPPQHGDARSDLNRLLDGLTVGRIRLSMVRATAGVLRSADFAATVVQVDDDVIAVEPGDTTAHCYGMAFDIGSTTLVGTLVDLTSGDELAVVARMNPQTAFGDDVVSRIQLCRTQPTGLERLCRAVVEALNAMIDALLSQAGIAADHVYRVVLAGNTTMQQLLCGIDPSALGELPFVPVFNRGLDVDAAAIGLKVADAAHAFVFPQIGGFVGGDTVAGILATGLDVSDGPALLVDIGTNGELVLAHGDGMTATSVAAGPAFEGARIVHGMRAAAGAVEKVVLDEQGDLAVNIIGDGRAAGLCGTALIDAVAELLRCGIIDVTGRILPPPELPSGLSPALRARVVADDDDHAAVILVPAGETVNRQPVCLFQKDIRELQLANAAIRAGINRLIDQAGIQAADLSRILLAGAFGNFIRRSNALRIGMLPPLPHDRIRFVGNAASLGAKQALLSNARKETAQAILKRVRHIDLSLDPEFQMAFGEAMLFPMDEP